MNRYEAKAHAHKHGLDSSPTRSWTSVEGPVEWCVNRNDGILEEIPYTKIKKIVYNTRGPIILGDATEAAVVIQAPVLRLCDIRFVETLMTGYNS